MRIETQRKLPHESHCRYNGVSLKINDWAREMSGWSSVNIYEWLLHKPTGRRLDEIRMDLEEELEARDAEDAKDKASDEAVSAMESSAAVNRLASERI